MAAVTADAAGGGGATAAVTAGAAGGAGAVTAGMAEAAAAAWAVIAVATAEATAASICAVAADYEKGVGLMVAVDKFEHKCRKRQHRESNPGPFTSMVNALPLSYTVSFSFNILFNLSTIENGIGSHSAE